MPFYAWQCITLFIKDKEEINLIIKDDEKMKKFLKFLIFHLETIDG